jgi:hypothetical protein
MLALAQDKAVEADHDALEKVPAPGLYIQPLPVGVDGIAVTGATVKP